MTSATPTGVDVVVAAQTLGTTVRRTPLDLSLRLSGKRHQPVLLKREDVQVGRSYKVRGAYNMISSLSPAELMALDHAAADEPDTFARQLLDLGRSRNFRVYGGCCGTDTAHLESLCRLMNELAPPPS